MIEVPLGIRATKYIGYVTLIDDEKYDLVAPYSWCVWPDGRVLYAARTWREAGRGSKSHFQFMHSLITGWPQVDHVNHDGLDNQCHNLRPATKSQNAQNKRADSGAASQYKGVSWLTFRSGRGKWQAAIAGKYLGLFDSEVDAALAYDAAALEKFGAYANPNFPYSEQRGQFLARQEGVS